MLNNTIIGSLLENLQPTHTQTDYEASETAVQGFWLRRMTISFIAILYISPQTSNQFISILNILGKSIMLDFWNSEDTVERISSDSQFPK